MGKVNANATTVNATGIALPTAGTGIVRNSVGNYTVTFDTARLDADYIIQLTLLNAGPTRTIEVLGTPTINSFIVQISELSLDTTPSIISNPIDAEWYFTVTDF